MSKAGFIGTSPVLENLEEWKALPNREFFWAIVDTESLGDAPASVSFLHNFQVCLLFNCRRNEALVNEILARLRAVSPQMIVHTEAYSLTGDLFSENYAIKLSLRSHIPDDYKIHRIKSLDRHPYFEESKQAYKDPELIELVAYLQSGLFESTERLSKEFVSASTTSEIPREQRALDSQLIEIDSAKTYIINHIRSQDGSSSGMFVLGKSGSGKSTLAHHVAQEIEKHGDSFAICVDYTLVTTREIYKTNVVALLDDFDRSLTESERSDWLPPNQTIYSLSFEELHNMVSRARTSKKLVNLSDPTRQIIISESDPAFVTRMFCFWEQSGRTLSDVQEEYANQAVMVDAAMKWYANLKTDLLELFLKYLIFAYKFACDSVETFSYKEILRYMAKAAIRLPELWDNLGKSAVENDLPPRVVRAINDRDSTGLVIEAFNFTSSTLCKFVLNTLAYISEERNICLFIDNVDQRPNREMEAISVKCAISFFDHEIHRVLPKARAVVFMRATTFSQHSWILADTIGWTKIEVKPPNFITALSRRCQEYRNNPSNQKNLSISSVNEVLQMVDNWMKSAPERATQKSVQKHNLLDIILARHPFNVRQQLARFGECCKNASLHEKLIAKNPLRVSGIENWTKRLSAEFYLKIFLLNDSEVYREDYDKVLNIYDAGLPNAPCNAIVRGAFLRWLRPGVIYLEGEFTDFLELFGLSAAIAKNTVRDFLRANLLLRTPRFPDKLILSKWGDYFCRFVAFDLPYIDTVWWDIAVPDDFDFGPVKRLVPSEIRGYCDKFVEWLSFEEQLFAKGLSDSSTIDRFFLSQHIQFNIQHSLRRIEQKLPTTAQFKSEPPDSN